MLASLSRHPLPCSPVMNSLARVKLGRFHTRRLCRYSVLPLPRNRAGTDLLLSVLLMRGHSAVGWAGGWVGGWMGAVWTTAGQDAVCLGALTHFAATGCVVVHGVA